jgi:hypothetical protein
MQEGAAEQAGPRAGGFCATQGKTEGTLGGRRRARGAADADNERPAILIETGQRNAPSVAAVVASHEAACRRADANWT